MHLQLDMVHLQRMMHSAHLHLKGIAVNGAMDMLPI